MSNGSSSAVAWSSLLEPAAPPEGLIHRPDDPRLGEIIETWRGDPAALRPGRAVLISFPQDEGIRRNHGRPGAAAAPAAIRYWLHRLPSADAAADVDLAVEPPLEVGNLGIRGNLEESQFSLGRVVEAFLNRGMLPIVLGGGHETAYGHFLGYSAYPHPVGIINLDAHLDVRPCQGGLGNSGSSFRQALEHPTHPLPGPRYVCLGVQAGSVSRAHLEFARARGSVVHWADELQDNLVHIFRREVEQLGDNGGAVYVSLDADVVQMADVPGVSAPSPAGLNGRQILACVRQAGALPAVSSFDLVEISPPWDRDGQSARWAALAIWHFLVGLAQRPRTAIT